MNFNYVTICRIIVCGYFVSVNSESTDFALSEITVGSVDLAGCKGSGVESLRNTVNDFGGNFCTTFFCMFICGDSVVFSNPRYSNKRIS